MKKCQKCIICPYIKECKQIKGKNFSWKINTKITCESHNLIYMIECQKERCQERYIGETERSLKYRISEHIGYINTKNKSKATGHHFNLPGHSLSDLKVTAIEKVKKFNTEYRKERESYLIRKFNTFYQGINWMP